jgi:16S rRNA processing protein RimM
MTDRLIQLARVTGAFGVRGELRIATFTGDPLAVRGYGPLLRQDGSHALTLTAARAVKGAVIARAKEVETRDQAEALKGLGLFVPRDALPEPDEDEFYLADLIGLTVEDRSGAVLGRVKAVENFGAGDILEIDPGSGRATFYLPFTRDAVPEVRIAEQRLIADPPAEVGEPEPNTETEPES